MADSLRQLVQNQLFCKQAPVRCPFIKSCLPHFLQRLLPVIIQTDKFLPPASLFSPQNGKLRHAGGFQQCKPCLRGREARRRVWRQYFKGMRVAQVGMRPKPFCSVIFNESDLMDKFDIHVIPVNLAVIQDKYNRILETRKDELAEGVAKLRQMYEIDDLSEPVLDKVYAFVLLYEEIFEEYNVAAVSAECWTAMQLMVGAMPCAAYPLLADMGYIIGCESDMHATLTQVVLKSLTLGQKKPFLGEFTTRHPSDRNVELLWHCGPFAYSLKKHGTSAKMVNMRQWMQVEDGHFTVARIDQDHGNYSIAVCECDSAEGPYTFGSYMWGKFKDLPAVERKLIEGPYIHHMSEIEGSLTDSIREFCKYVPGLTFDGLD